MKFFVAIFKHEREGYFAECSSIPGCISYGQTEEEAKEKIKKAVEISMRFEIENIVPVAKHELEVDIEYSRQKTRIGLRNTIYNEFNELLASYDDLYFLAEKIMDEMESKNSLRTTSPIYEKVCAILFSEAYSRFPAIKTLCEDGLSHSALIVLRSLLNLFFIFHWISHKHTNARAKRYLGWYWKTMMYNIKNDPSNYDKEFKKEVRNNYRSIKHLYIYKRKSKCQLKRKKARFWYDPLTIDKMAKDVGLEEHYKQGYKPLSWVEHLDPTVTLLRAKTGKITFDPGFDKIFMHQALLMSLSYFRNICESITTIFNLEIKKEIEKLAEPIPRFIN